MPNFIDASIGMVLLEVEFDDIYRQDNFTQVFYANEYDYVDIPLNAMQSEMKLFIDSNALSRAEENKSSTIRISICNLNGKENYIIEEFKLSYSQGSKEIRVAPIANELLQDQSVIHIEVIDKKPESPSIQVYKCNK